MKRIFAPHLNHHVVVGGRRRPKSYARRPLFAMLGAEAALPTPPAEADYRTPARAVLSKMFLNDQYGDCVIAGRGHRIGVLTSNAGTPFCYTDAQIVAEYERIGGFDPKNPTATDQGCDMSAAADDGVTHGYADGSRDVAWVDVDPTDKLAVMRAVYLFEHGDLGLELPDAWIDPFPSAGTVWDVAGPANPENGHDIQIVAYNAEGVFVSTWGLDSVLITWAALAKYGTREAYGELIVHLSPDEIEKASQKAPSGLDWRTLIGYFNGMGGKAPVPPAPTPAPPPAPVPAPNPPAPPGAVTLAQAEAWAKAGIAKAPKGVVTVALATKLATEGLAAHWPK